MSVEKETCIVCKCETNVDVDTHVEKRNDYVIGVGQCCHSCYSNIYHIEEKFYDEEVL